MFSFFLLGFLSQYTKSENFLEVASRSSSYKERTNLTDKWTEDKKDYNKTHVSFASFITRMEVEIIIMFCTQHMY